MGAAFIVPVRNDLNDSALQLLDLKPNTSSRNQIREPVGQTFYPSHSMDLTLTSVRTGTAQAGAGGTVTLDAGASAVNDNYNGQWVRITGGTGVGQVRNITDYVGATKVATIAPNWGTNPDNTSTFEVFTQGDKPVLAGNDLSGDNYSLAVYLMDHVENKDGGGSKTLSVVQSQHIAFAIMNEARQGNALTSAAVKTLIDGASGVSGSDLDGTQVGGSKSTGSVASVLKILSGSKYKVESGKAMQGGASAFLATGPGGTHVPQGFFVTAANVEKPESVKAANGGSIRGRNPFTTPIIPVSTPAQSGTQDTNHRQILSLAETGDLHRSVVSGALSKLKAATYLWKNSAFTYGSGGSAKDILGTVLPTTGIHAAFKVYDANGNAI